ncbi:Amidophosphoribosyltransferase family protein [Borrelia nietonii YOR]|uniref:Amidophosphoribosyltransferase family protein n=1 Tax=Borrelia nietonii YOR TaxID=1293576 RepID=A0ABN4C523_9SPIR|nr:MULTISPECIES: amidophosphoribosyltransferase [Borrelia]AHH03811.1 Amidophosphoribosyltransferase family protein [Borrelia nietonii YOR]AHH14295.1 Amidophosphoribosyltransferase family protein [Borrelia hermsii MTW]UPA09478.1 amidophosphoribosyltransferase [Borrelia nietonii YOR]
MWNWVVLKSIFFPLCSCCHKNYVYLNALCKDCIEFFHFDVKSRDDVWYFFEYKNECKKLLLAYKRDGQRLLGQFFANGILQFLMSIDFDLVVSVPCSFKRRIFYGFDHMEYIGDLLGNSGIKYVNVFKRGLGKSQKLLRGDLRHSNLENKVKLKLKYRNIDFKRVVLIDDIVTTGSSMTICKDILIKHGACSVIKLSLARV